MGGLRHPPKADTQKITSYNFSCDYVTNYDSLKKNIIIGGGAQVIMQN